GCGCVPHRRALGNFRLDDRRHLPAARNAHEPDDGKARPRRVGAQPPHADARRIGANRRIESTEPFMHRKFLVFLAAAGIAALGAVALSARAKTPVNLAANNPGPAAVSLAKVVTVKSAPREEITGALNPAKELKVGFEVGGRLARILVRKGAFVGEGQVIAQLDPELADAQVLQAEAAANAAQAQFAMASDTAQRQTQLQQTGSVSEWQGKSANSQATAASAQLQAARAQLAQARAARKRHD